jgi:hypothetical protein
VREIRNIVIHCADTPTGRKTTVEDIDSWHVERGFKRNITARQSFNPNLKAIGYHFVIYIDGTVHTGRHVEEIGAHVSGLNSSSVGVCLAGNGVYNELQWEALATLVTNLMQTYPLAKVIGHYQTPSGAAQGKICPSFDVPQWMLSGFAPQDGHVA